MNKFFALTELFDFDCYKHLFFDSKLNLWTDVTGSMRRTANQTTFSNNVYYPHTLFRLKEIFASSDKFKNHFKQNPIKQTSKDIKNDLFAITDIFIHDSCYHNHFFDKKMNLWVRDNGVYSCLENQKSFPLNGINYRYSLSFLKLVVSSSEKYKEYLKQFQDDNNVQNKSLKGKFIIAQLTDDTNEKLKFSIAPFVFSRQEDAVNEMINMHAATPNQQCYLFECKGALKFVDVVLE